jgi:RNA polymerase sigma-70 factor, ECF subfamily
MHPGTPETRASLILRLQDASDMDAWDEFAALYSPVIYQAAMRRGFQRADAENIVQEVMMAVARSIKSWLERSEKGRFRPWLLRIARNSACDLMTARATRPLGKNGDEAERILSELSDRSHLSSELDLEYERAVFHWAARKIQGSIAEHTWQAFWLTQVEGMPASLVANRLKIRVANVYIARCRVMARIKQLVMQYQGDHLPS